jgi:mannose-6-phosphate isomerase-like protein (cupin superfamily)
MEAKDRSDAAYVGPGEGRAMWMPGAQLLTRKVSSEQTGGAYSLFEAAVRPGGGSDPHIQHEEDECFYVLEGVFEFFIEGVRIEVGPGSLIYIPMGTLHAFENVGEATGKLLMSQTPGGLHERFIEEIGEEAQEPNPGKAATPAATPSSDFERLAEIGVEYGVEAMWSPLIADTREVRETSQKMEPKEGDRDASDDPYTREQSKEADGDVTRGRSGGTGGANGGRDGASWRPGASADDAKGRP